MTTIEKARKLVAMFESIAHPTFDCDKQFAKEAAMRCADELISAFKSSACRDVHMEYWIEVKQEIQKL